LPLTCPDASANIADIILTDTCIYVTGGEMSTPSNNPLSALVIDSPAATTEQLAETLRGRVRIDPASRSVFIEDDKMDARQRVLLALLGWQALAMLAEKDASTTSHSAWALTPREITEIAGLPGGTVRRTLRELLAERFVQQDDGYFVPVAALMRVRRILTRTAEE
jgi:hypothetical protein